MMKVELLEAGICVITAIKSTNYHPAEMQYRILLWVKRNQVEIYNEVVKIFYAPDFKDREYKTSLPDIRRNIYDSHFKIANIEVSNSKRELVFQLIWKINNF